MPENSRPFAWNPGHTAYVGTEIVGDLSIGIPNSGFNSTGLSWWNGPDESNGYIVAKPNSSGNQPNPIGGSAYLGFSRSDERTDASFIKLAEFLLGGVYGNPKEAVDALYVNGYWTSYASPVLSLDANNYNYLVPDVWYDDVNNRAFNLNGNFVWHPQETPGIEGYFRFGPSTHNLGPGWAQSNSGLGSMPQFSISVWHRWSGFYEANASLIEDRLSSVSNYRIGVKSTAQINGSYNNGAVQSTGDLSVLSAGSWYNIVLTCDLNQNLSIYLDGILMSVVKTTGSQPSSFDVGIRLMRSSEGSFWDGDIGKIEIYDRILKPFQIVELYNKDTARFPVI